MRKYSLGTTLIVLCMILLGSGPPPFTLYENEKYGYRLDVPDGFTMQGDWGMQTSWIYLPGEKENFEAAIFPIISVIAYEIPKRFSTVSLYNTKMKKVQEIMFKEVNTDDDQALNHWYVKVYGNGREYTIEISGTRQQLRERRSEFKHVVESFSLIP
jgi:hypothetical protein